MAENTIPYELLHENVKRLIWQLNWDHLRDIQENAIVPILSKETDVIISAPTASGKTEAAFLPILSDLVTSEATGLGVLYVSPLKALINDQFERLGLFCEKLGIPINDWHGDVGQSKKEKVFKNPGGILLITPESVEALFVNRGHAVPAFFSTLRYIVIDELHSFIGSERGKQLQSLLHRIEVVTKRVIPRIGLSATLGDLQSAATFMRLENNLPCKIIKSTASSQDVKLQIRGYRIGEEPPIIPVENESKPNPDAELIETYGDKFVVGVHLYKTLRGTNNLIFANSRNNTEEYADLLREKSEQDGVPNEFFPHHGSLSKELREDIEQRLKNSTLPTTAVCTSTLELGIDIGSVTSIGQIGSPPNVSSMRQRLGRSGRRGEPGIMRLYIQEKEVTSETGLLDGIRPHLVQSIALTNMLIKGWYETPQADALHLSTFIQQILSSLAQYGSLTAVELWQILGIPFSNVGKPTFIDLLKCLSASEVIQQDSDGSIVLGLKGERITSHYGFYASFTTPQEYQIYNKGSHLGSIPISVVLSEGLCIIFGGRRWKILSIDLEKRIIDVERARGGKPPSFGGSGMAVSKEVRAEMKRIYMSDEVPVFLDKTAISLLAEARDYFSRFELDKHFVIDDKGHALLFHWDSDIVANTILLQLKEMGYELVNEGIALEVTNSVSIKVLADLNTIVTKGFNNNLSLASTVANKVLEKYDNLLTEPLQTEEYASRLIDVENANRCVAIMVN
jgi:ATP-dependent Lhr-like helicase